MTDDDLPVNEEHFDSIPWSSLIPQSRDRPWLVYVAAGAVVALVVGVVAARGLQSASRALDPVAVVTEAAETVSAPPTSQPISEADLQAEIQPGEAGAAAAAMRAEWFVTDYFTRDGAGGRQAELTGALGRPAPADESDVTTYVEWARAWDAVPESDGRYRVLVAFRSIAATDTGFVRQLARGVAVRVQVAPDGGTRVVDLPEPVELPPAPVLAAPPAPEAIPESVVRKALNQAASWGNDATVLEGINDDGTWRVLIEATDTYGTAWPLVVWVEATGDHP